MERTLAAVLALITAPVVEAMAQCPEWTGGFALPGLQPPASALERFDDGSGDALYAAGPRFADGFLVDGMARFDGTVWTRVGTSLTGSPRALAVFDDGSGRALYAAGSIALDGGAPAERIARWNGASWTDIGSATGGTIEALCPFDDGSGASLVATGSFTQVGGVAANRLARWNGASWSEIGGGLAGRGWALSVFDDGSGSALLVAGEFVAAGGIAAPNIARWNGSVWSALGIGTNGAVRSLAVHDDGSGRALYAAGEFNAAGGVTAWAIARWRAGAWSPVGVTGANYFAYEVASADDGNGRALFLGGTFNGVDGVPVRNIARWDGTSWSPLGGGVHSSGVPPGVSALAEFDDGGGSALYVSGRFNSAGTLGGQHVIVDNITRWRGGAWLTAGAGDGLALGSRDLSVCDFGGGPQLYATSWYLAAGSPVRLDATSWTAVGGGTNGAVHAIEEFDDGSGPKLFATGSFTRAGIVDANSIAQWDGTSWTALGSGSSGTGTALGVDRTGSIAALVVAGSFSAAGGVAANGVARWDGVGWNALGAGIGGGPYAQKRAITTFDDGGGAALFVGGEDLDVGDGTFHGIVRWNGSSWVSGDAGLSTAACYALAVYDDGGGPQLFAGGFFILTGSEGWHGVVRWNGSGWSAAGAQAGPPTWTTVEGLTVFDEGLGEGPELLAVGTISSFIGTPSLGNVARFDGVSWRPVGGAVEGTYPPTCAAMLETPAERSLFVGGNFDYANNVGLGAPGFPSRGIARRTLCADVGELFCFGDGSGTACPCGNASTSSERAGCLNSLGIAGTLRARGGASLAHDNLRLEATQMSGGAALFFQGAQRVNGGAGLVFGDGLRCAGGTVVRLSLEPGTGGNASIPNAGDPPLSVIGLITASSRHAYQTWYRNAVSGFCTPSTFNLTNAVEILWLP